MKKVIGFFAALMFCGAAHAARVVCQGDYFGYHFVLQANTSGNRVVGNIRINVTNGQQRMGGTMRPTSSDVRIGRYIRLAARARNGSTGALSVAYDAGSRLYRGTLQASSSRGSANVPVTCSARGSFVDDRISSETDPEIDFSALEDILL